MSYKSKKNKMNFSKIWTWIALPIGVVVGLAIAVWTEIDEKIEEKVSK